MKQAAEITLAIQSALADFSLKFRNLQTEFILSGRHESGAWMDRSGNPDLYYTRFAINCLSALGVCESVEGDPTLRWLREQSRKDLHLIDAFCLLDCVMLLREAVPGNVDNDLTERARSMAAEQARLALAPVSGAPFPDSLYMLFLACMVRERLGGEVDDLSSRDKDLIRFIHEHQREDGGFSDTLDQKRGQTNPTAAAIGMLTFLNGLTGGVCDSTAKFLHAVQRENGGLAAGGQAPYSDLLSTFTGLTALRSMERLDGLRLADLGGFVRSVMAPGGGFHGWPGDEAADMEYTFYGLGATAILLERRGRQTDG